MPVSIGDAARAPTVSLISIDQGSERKRRAGNKNGVLKQQFRPHTWRERKNPRRLPGKALLAAA